nr:hypothetical protein [uncultured bacterium]AUH21337.1 hypothetical protein [uncultured bacterium]AUH21343.1 hypothetical protein [uncultured bacterium]AUH21349.1 hypothetical protein [uncultured bacterium]
MALPFDDKELKYIDTSWSHDFQQPGAHYSALQQTLVPITSGKSGTNERIGNTVFIKGIELRGTVIMPSHGFTADYQNWDRVRLLIFDNNSQNELPITAEDVLDTFPVDQGNPVPSTLSFYNVNGFDKFTIWSDITYGVLSTSNIGTTSGDMGAAMTHVSQAYNKSLQVKYSGPQSSDFDQVDNITSNNLCILALSETGAATYNLNMRVYYTD